MEESPPAPLHHRENNYRISRHAPTPFQLEAMPSCFASKLEAERFSLELAVWKRLKTD